MINKVSDGVMPEYQKRDCLRRRKIRKLKRLAVMILFIILIIGGIIAANQSKDTKKYYTCRGGQICYPESTPRKGCDIEFDSYEKCNLFIKR
jgi:hypothetical protein